MITSGSSAYPRPERVNILGVGVSALNLNQAASQLACWIEQQVQTYVVVCPVYTLMQSFEHEDLRIIANHAGMVTPDGMPLVFLGRLLGYSIDRVYGPDLMLAFSKLAQEHGYRNFYYGGAEGVAEQLAKRLRERFPGLNVAGCYAPPFRDLSPDEEAAIVEQINAATPDIVWVGLGSPKQDRWMAAHRKQLNASVLVGVGAAFDFHAGRVAQAPRWMQSFALEWLFRLAQEPRRLWRRYLIYNPKFLFHASLQLLGVKRYSLDL